MFFSLPSGPLGLTYVLIMVLRIFSLRHDGHVILLHMAGYFHKAIIKVLHEKKPKLRRRSPCDSNSKPGYSYEISVSPPFTQTSMPEEV